MRKRLLIIGILVVAVAGASSYYLLHREMTVAQSKVVPQVKKVTPAPAPTPKPAAFSKEQYSLTDPTSMWIVVNKQRPLAPQNYVPPDLVDASVAVRVSGTQVRQATSTALQALFAAAQTNGTPLKVSSGYRSYNYQVNLYNGYVKTQGQATADSQSARPGFSEHQTGLAADLANVSGGCNVEQCFGATPAGKWLAAEGYKYGFIIRYPEGKTDVTGYEYEPWHVRYVGVELATEMHNTGAQTMEEFFGLPAAPNY